MWCSSLMIVIYFEMHQKIRWTNKKRHRKRARQIKGIQLDINCKSRWWRLDCPLNNCFYFAEGFK